MDARTEIKSSLKNGPIHASRDEQLKRISLNLRAGQRVTDAQFDQLYPLAFRKFSVTHWTPVTVAVRAVELLGCSDRTRVLDVGAGIGKFCTIASLSSRGQFIGVEKRTDFTEIARKTVRELNLDRVSIILGDMAELDWSFFDAFYLFNPFYEDQDKFARYVDITRKKLKFVRAGTKVVTYHGFGGEMPADFNCLQKILIGTDQLMLWVKMSHT